MALTGLMQKSKKETRAIHLKWMELEHITDEMKNAMHDAYFPYVAAGRITLKMQEVLYRYYNWCERFYGKKA